jgi:hypothetical protein
MIAEILKTLSDGELMAIADQLANPSVDEQLLYRQIVSKGNKGETVEEMFEEMNSDNFRGTLPRLVAVEISLRYKTSILNRLKSRIQ